MEKGICHPVMFSGFTHTPENKSGFIAIYQSFTIDDIVLLCMGNKVPKQTLKRVRYWHQSWNGPLNDWLFLCQNHQ